MWRIRNVRRLSDSKGANLVEAAIITPLLLLLTLAIVDFSAMFYCYLALEHGVSQATRYAVTGQQMSSGGSPIGREASHQVGHAHCHADAHHSRQRLQLQLHADERLELVRRPRRPERRRTSHGQLHLAIHDAARPSVLQRRPGQPARAVNHEERNGVPVTTSTHRRLTRFRAARGQSIVEFAIILPFLLVICLGVVETAYALIDQHVVTKLAREGSNLISRDTTLQQAAKALTEMQTQPLNFSNGTSTVIFSVVAEGCGRPAQPTSTRSSSTSVRSFGTLPCEQQVEHRKRGVQWTARYAATNPTTNTGLQVTNLPDSLINVNGGFLYVTEIFTRHNLITPLDRLMPYGVTLPRTLYSIAYF